MGTGESESDELSGVRGGDGEAVKGCRGDTVERGLILVGRGDCRRARLRVIRGVVQDGRRDSLGNYVFKSGDAGGANSVAVFLSSGCVYIPVLESVGDGFRPLGQIRPEIVY